MSRSHIYAHDSFAYRVNFAASVIARGGEATRDFASCFEMYDGDDVTAALVRRAKARPDGRLAQNLFRRLGESSALEHYEATKRLTRRELTQHAAHTRAAAQRASALRSAKHRAERDATASHAFSLIDLDTDDLPTRFDTKTEAESAAAFDRLPRYEIWNGDTLVTCVDAAPNQI